MRPKIKTPPTSVSQGGGAGRAGEERGARGAGPDPRPPRASPKVGGDGWAEGRRRGRGGAGSTPRFRASRRGFPSPRRGARRPRPRTQRAAAALIPPPGRSGERPAPPETRPRAPAFAGEHLRSGAARCRGRMASGRWRSPRAAAGQRKVVPSRRFCGGIRRRRPAFAI